MQSNPILKNIRNFSLYLLFWVILVLLYFLFLVTGESIEISIAITDSLIFNFILSGLGLSFWYSAKYISFENNKISRIVLSHALGGVITSVIWLSLGYFIITSMFPSSSTFKSFFYSTLVWRFLIGFLFYFLITTFYYVIIYYTGFQERIIREAELKNLIAQAELRSLKFQINPHFIFNSLNSMSALTTIDPDKARSMILKLADFLRYTLANNEKQKNKLKEELHNINLYLEIEKIRFEDKFDFVEDVESGCLESYVPNMILQPLIENAIKHAVYESIEKVILKLECKKVNEFMNISLENNFESGNSKPKGAGIGIKNISDRLELLYGRKNLLKVKKDNKIFRVDLYIPASEC
jgi:two-component system, LytTR family, sensor kinase